MIGSLNTTKSGIEKAHSATLDLQATMEVRAKKDSALTPKVAELSAAAEGLHTFLGLLRGHISELVGLSADSEDVDGMIAKATSLTELGETHLAGYRAMSKRMRALL